MKISHIAWSREDQDACVGCGEKTAWKDNVCNDCTVKAPKYISYNQMKRFYTLKRRKK